MDTTSDSPFAIHHIDGQSPGPRLLITAGVHGDEYLSIAAVQDLVRRFAGDPPRARLQRGSLDLIPVVNRSAYCLRSRCGEDQLDLARICPGRADGNLSERVAFAISQQIKAADYYIDLHTGGTELSVHPLAGYVLHKHATILDRQRQMARAFQLPLVWGTSPELPGRTLSVARDAAVPAIYVEYLGAHREMRELVSNAMRGDESSHPLVSGCLNVMRSLHMLEEPESTAIQPEVIEDSRPQSGHMQVANPSPVSGFLKIKVDLGQRVSPGDLLAEITADVDRSVYPVRSQQSGTVVVLRDMLTVRKDDSIAVIAESYPPR